jgi:hypothetical protein
MNPFLESILVTIPDTTFPSKFGNEAFDSRIRFSRKLLSSSFSLFDVVVFVGVDDDDNDVEEEKEKEKEEEEEEESERVNAPALLFLRRSLPTL